MPLYDLIVFVKHLNRDFLKTVLTRNAKYVIESGGLLRSIENLGLNELHRGIKPKNSRKIEYEAHFFNLNYYAGEKENRDIVDKFRRDVDVMRSISFASKSVPGGSIFPKKEPECTLHEDLKPAPYRPAVIKILKKGKQLADKEKSKKPSSFFQNNLL